MKQVTNDSSYLHIIVQVHEVIIMILILQLSFCRFVIGEFGKQFTKDEKQLNVFKILHIHNRSLKKVFSFSLY